MTKKELIAKIKELEELESTIDDMEKVAESIRDEIKGEMVRKKLDEYEIDKYIIRWTSVLSNKFDTKAFKEAHAKMYKEFTKQVSSRRFSISK